jgi:uncharacterized protein (DUF1330 family)
MSAYLIANVDIKDSERIQKYLASTPEILKKYTGRFLVRGGQIWVAEGNWSPARLVVVEFDTFEKAKEFWNSPDYKPLKDLRQSSADTDMIIVDGITLEMSEKLNGK